MAARKPTKRAARKPNPCVGASILTHTVPDTHWGVRLPFVPSTKGLTAYAKLNEHDLVYDRRVSPPKVTFDEKAMEKLLRKYPNDVVYTAIDQYRKTQKCKGTYADGMYVHPDRRVRGTPNHNPKTLRLAMKDPSLQVLPRIDPTKPSVYDMVRGIFVAPEGRTFLARDFSGIESVIVFYLANDKDGVRLALRDVHSFFTSHVVKEPADLNWSDDNLFGYLKDIKKRHAQARQACKAVVHASAYGTTPFKMAMMAPELFPTKKDAAYYQDAFFDLFPSIRRWQWETCRQADEQGYITAPDGFRQHFSAAMQWEWDEKTGKWVQDFGPQAKECLAAVPQHMGMSFLARAANSLYHEHFDEVGQYLRLLIHDEIFLEIPEPLCDDVDRRVKEVMERPHPDMPLPAEWGRGRHLAILTESKRGPVWATMK